MTDAASRYATLFHLVAFGIYAYVIHYTVHNLNIPYRDHKHAYAGRAKYFTIGNLVSNAEVSKKILRGEKHSESSLLFEVHHQLPRAHAQQLSARYMTTERRQPNAGQLNAELLSAKTSERQTA